MERYHLYILFTRTKTTVSRLIYHIKHDKYTHTAIALDKDFNSMYSFGRKWTRNPFVGRFKQEHLAKGLYHNHKVLPGAIVEIEVSREQYYRVKELIEYFVAKRKALKYNYKGLIQGLLNREACYEDRFLCSEFVYFVLKESDVLDLQRARNLVRPQDLYETMINDYGRLVYEGDLKELNPYQPIESVSFSSSGRFVNR